MPEIIISSGAKRALSLAKIVQEELNCKLTINDDLYGPGTRAVLKIIQSFDNEYEKIMIVGHNPELTDFINLYGSMSLLNLPTSGIVRIRFHVEKWSEALKGHTDLYMWPKLLNN